MEPMTTEEIETLTPGAMEKLQKAADRTAIGPHYYALIMLSRAIERGDWLRAEDWWQGTPEHLARFKAEFESEPPRA